MVATDNNFVQWMASQVHGLQWTVLRVSAEASVVAFSVPNMLGPDGHPQMIAAWGWEDPPSKMVTFSATCVELFEPSCEHLALVLKLNEEDRLACWSVSDADGKLLLKCSITYPGSAIGVRELIAIVCRINGAWRRYESLVR